MYASERNRVYVMAVICLFFFWMAGAQNHVFAKSDTEIEQFVGRYLCGVKTVGEYGNPEVLSLGFNGEGQLQRYSGMYYGTTGTSTYYNYTDYYIEDNVLTCIYDGAYGYYGAIEEIGPGSHQYFWNEDGSIITETEVWYRYENQDGEEYKTPRTLRAVRELDFPYGGYTSDAAFLGIQELSRKEIESIVFMDTFNEMPESTWDVSAAQDGSVKLWINEADSGCQVCIAADGGVIANYNSSDLFRLCTNLTEIDFNSAFDTSGTVYFSHMFRDCKKLSFIRGINTLDTSMAYDMSKMFYGCRNLDVLEIDDIFFPSGCTTIDIFGGTKWEGSSPLLDYVENTVSTACILDTAVLQESPRLRASVVNGYDDVLVDLVQDKINLWGEWKDTSCYIFYDMEDINGDGIPELIIRTNTADGYSFELYYFDIVSCTVREMAVGTLWSKWPELYWYPEECVLRCSTEGGERIFRAEATVLRELYDDDINGLQYEALEFTLAAPECLEYYVTDLSGDDTENEVQLKASVNGAGNYNYLVVYIDNVKVFGKELSGRYSNIEYYPFYTYYEETEDETDDIDIEESEGQNASSKNEERSDFLYIHVGSDSSSEYTALLEYEDGSLSEGLVMSDLVETDQLRSDYGNENYFAVSVEDENSLKVTFYLNTYGLGNNLEFSVNYIHSQYSGFRQSTFVADIDNTWSQSQNVTARRSFDVFRTVGSKDEIYTVSIGDHIYYDKIWLSNGYLWVRIENESGDRGWMPLGDEVLFEEVGKKIEDPPVWEKILGVGNGQKYFNLAVPDAGTLYQLGEQYFDAEDFDTAEIYFELVSAESSHYGKAQELLNIIRSNVSDISIEETAAPYAIDEKALYAEYMKENVSCAESDAGYAVLDINGDGRKELLVYYGAANAACEVYTFDEQSGGVRYAGSIDPVHYDLYYSKQYQALVCFWRASDSHSYSFYCFDGENVDWMFNVGWHDVKGETYTRYFSYTDNTGSLDLGHYVYVGEQENVGKAEAEKNYHEYLQYMMKIEFVPIGHCVYEGEQQYAYELSTDNIPIDDIGCMLPVIYTYLNSGRTSDPYSFETTTFDTSYRAEDFWPIMQTYSVFDYDYHSGTYSMDEIQHIAHSLFSDYDGSVPGYIDGMGIQFEGDSVTFHPAQPEERNVVLLEFEVQQDGSIDAVYSDQLMGYGDPVRKLFAHFIRNELVDYTSYTPLYYRIASLESLNEEGEGAYTEVIDQEIQEELMSDEYIFADSDSQYISVEDLEGLDAETLRYARNEIYARHGRRFNDQELQNYFDLKSWYQGTISPEDFQDSMLSDVERENAELILAYENGEI